MALIFAVDDDSQVRELLKVLFEDQGHEVLSLESGIQCLDRLDENPSAIFLDMVMPEMDGIATLKAIRNIQKDLPVIMATSVDDSGSIVQAMKLGAFDYVVKPFDETRLFAILDKALDQTTLVGQVSYLKDELSKIQGFGGIVGKSAELTKISINLFLISSITTSNKISEICKKIGANWSEMSPALRMDKRIGKYA